MRQRPMRAVVAAFEDSLKQRFPEVFKALAQSCEENGHNPIPQGDGTYKCLICDQHVSGE